MNDMSDAALIQHVLQSRHNYYRVLMVDRSAGDKEIKAAYRKMALRCHPDKCTHAHAADAFKLIGTAYTTLSDSTKRQVYDRQGVEGVQRHESTAARRHANGAAAAAAGGGMRRAAPQNAHEFFQEFFFGNDGGIFGNAGGGAHYANQQRAYAYAHRRGGGGGGGGGNGAAYEQADMPAVWLMLLPVVIFIVLAVMLQSSMMDVAAASSSSSSRSSVDSTHSGGGGGAWRDVSLTPEPDRGVVMRREVSLRGMQVPYYTTRLQYERISRSTALRREVEKEVLRRQLSYLANLCDADTLRYRRRQRNDVPPVCSELQRFRKVLS